MFGEKKLKKNDIKKFPFESLLLGSLPEGCKLCHQGLKSVIFVSGICNGGCYYCPLSEKRNKKDIIFANEKMIKSEPNNEIIDKIIEEVEISGSNSISLTGGDPLIKSDRTLNIAKRLKENFGDKFHIHIYTLGRNNSDSFSKLAEFIDEIRFHLHNESDFKGLQTATEFNWDVGLEVPGLPGFEKNKWTNEGMKILNGREKSFININELEYSETNYQRLIENGITFDEKGRIPDYPNYAVDAMKHLNELYPNPSIHFCSIVEKDQVQLPNRILRRAKNIAYPFDIIMEEGKNKGLLLRGEIRINKSEISLSDLVNFLQTDLELLEQEDFVLDKKNDRILISPVILEDSEFVSIIRQIFANKINLGLIMEYPTSDQLKTSYIPVE